MLGWCLPGLLLAITLRIVLMWQMPMAVYHDDSPDFLTTPDRLLFEHRFELHSKKTFLTPILFSVPFLLHVPALITIPVFQHVLGLLVVLMVGLLCRLWFTHWKLFIVPLTVIAAADPFMLWYEHTIMAETLFLFCTLTVAVAGTLYALKQSPARFYFLCLALFLTAGARPEGKLLFGFGIVFVAFLHFRTFRESWPRLAAMILLALTTHLLTATSQAGLLLYTSVARLTPHDLKCAPGFEPYIAPIRADLQRRWDEKPSFPKVNDRRAIAEAVRLYLRTNVDAKRAKHSGVNDFCLKLAKETCRKNLLHLPVHAYEKFRFSANDSPSGLLDDEWLFSRQYAAYNDESGRAVRLSRGLTGITLNAEADFEQFVDTHYVESHWFNSLAEHWLAFVDAWRLPDAVYPDLEKPSKPFVYHGIPVYFLLGAAGLIAVAFRRGPVQPFHIIWALTLFGFFFTIMLTANIRPRFRFVFEPFWFLYIALLIETICLGIQASFRRP
ncbi:MAG: hypothetical protein JWL59_5105 [Chthoniobacteraceae bacterium]|nr:hypothetical protein [Chthoniobacteraceae bacterium]